ncbi:hypothetical protein VNO77_02766 [Canavalia gladiata]|uniref:Knottins-like domain-containing protein n=1 Tax=Canavalia gladiata TaxID=3824 RepID=A0AAN9R6D8_CANGL
MARSMPLVSTIFVLLQLLVATEMGPTMVAEAETCEYKSKKQTGPCVDSTKCSSECKTQGSTGGRCRGIRRICWCTKECVTELRESM